MLATNVAESSVTVEGVVTVIDTGIERRLELDPVTGLDRLELRPISKQSAEQRRGRAGRERQGRCVRLWTKSEHSSRLEQTPAEIKRVDLATPLLILISWGEHDPQAFPWFEAPDPARTTRALDLLARLGAIEAVSTDRWRATSDGEGMARLGCHPRLGRLLLHCARHGATRRGCLLAALLEERDVFKRPPKGWQATPTRSDVLDRLHAVESGLSGQRSSSRLIDSRARRVDETARSLERSLRSLDLERGLESDLRARGSSRDSSDELLLEALLLAFPDRLVARRPAQGERASSSRGVMVGGTGVRLADSSGVRTAPLFLALDVRRTGGGASTTKEALVFLASEVQRSWLDLQGLQEQREVVWDAESGRARAQVVTRLADLALETLEVPATDDEIEAALARRIIDDPQAALPLDSPGFVQLAARIDSLASWRPDLDLIEPLDAIVEDAHVLSAGCRTAADLDKLDLVSHLLGRLPWTQRQALDELAPAEMKLENGTRGRLVYSSDSEPPILALRIQQLFGVRDTPRVDGGRRAVLLHLLAPNQRPQQITTDLAGFWSGSYALVRKELAGRYPKHPWPDDPASASPPSSRRRRRD